MFIVFSHTSSTRNLLPRMTKILWGLTIGLSAAFCFLLGKILFSNPKLGQIALVSNSELSLFPLEKIGQGPLSLHFSKQKKLLQEISQEVCLLASNARPSTLAKKEGAFILSLKNSFEKRTVKEGEIVYLSCEPTAGDALPVYHFSAQTTPLWIRPSSLNSEKTMLEVGLCVPSKEHESFYEEKQQFILQKNSYSTNQENKPFFLTQLEKANLLGPDVFLTRFCTPPSSAWKDKVKVEIPGSPKQTICLLGIGDLLEWHEGSWIPTDLSASLEGKPLAKVQAVTPRSLTIEAWDETGFFSSLIKLESSSRPLSTLKQEILPHGAVLKNTKQVSCYFGKKRALLKEGDMVLKTKHGWKTLKRAEDIEQYIHLKLFGELMIFESLVQEKGHCFLKGYWLDSMRTQMQPFSIPVSLEPIKGSSKTKKKRTPVSQSEKSFNSYLPSASLDKSTPSGKTKL